MQHTVTFYPNKGTTTGVDKTLKEIWELITQGTYRETPKDNAPAFTPHGYGSRAHGGTFTPNGIVHVDIDHWKNVPEGYKEAIAFRNKLKDDPYIIGAFVSHSLRGVKVFARYETNFQLAWEALKGYVESKYGVKVDGAAKDLKRLCFIPADTGAWLTIEGKEPIERCKKEFDLGEARVGSN